MVERVRAGIFGEAQTQDAELDVRQSAEPGGFREFQLEFPMGGARRARRDRLPTQDFSLIGDVSFRKAGTALAFFVEVAVADMLGSHLEPRKVSAPSRRAK